jgi:hypothetical protein
MKFPRVKTTLVLAAVAISTFAIWQIGCATTGMKTTDVNEPSASAAYQYALDNAFNDLGQKEAHRKPASTSEQQIFITNFQKTQYFEMVMTPKLMRLNPHSGGASKSKIVQGGQERFQFRIDRQGHCALAGDLVPENERDQCVQVEIKPVNSKIPGKQFVRVFMTPDYRVKGVSFHEYDIKNDRIKKERRLVQWDPSEPLSSELLALSSEVVPLDLPVYASNRLHKEQGTVRLTPPRTESNCDGWNYRYRNTYGAWVNVGWCETDPWPSRIETNRYSAVLIPGKGN